SLAQLSPTAEASAAQPHQPQHDPAEAALEGSLQCAIPRIRFGSSISLLAERLAQEATEIAIVLDQQYLHAANLWRARGPRQCEHDEKALRKARATSLGNGVLAHSAHEHCTVVGAQPHDSARYRDLCRRLLLDHG